MEIEDLLAELRRAGPEPLVRAGAPFLFEEGRLLHDTKRVSIVATRIVERGAEDQSAAEGDEVAQDITHRRVYRLVRRDASRDGPITIGRADLADVQVPVSSVSKLHASFLRGENGWTVKDLGSTNGTFLDGDRVPAGVARPLVSSSVLRFGTEVKLTFLDAEAAARFLAQLDAVLAVRPDHAAPDAQLKVDRAKVLGAAALPAYLDEDEAEEAAPAAEPQAPDKSRSETSSDDAEVAPTVPTVTMTSAGTTSGRFKREDIMKPEARVLALECKPFPLVAITEARPISIGRVVGNDLVLPHPRISRRHAQVVRSGDEVTVIDLGSANGVTIEGRRVERATIAPGAVVVMGPYELRVVEGVDAAPPAGEGSAPIAILGQVSLRGVLEDVPLDEMLQGIEFNRKTGVVEIQDERGVELGSIVFRGGEPLRAVAGELRGEAALKKLVGLRRGRFVVRADDVRTQGERELKTTFTRLLLEIGREQRGKA